jgi:hypothetical protein
MLMMRNYTGVTPLTAAAHAGHVDQIPPQLRPAAPGLIQQALIRMGWSKPPF